MNEGFAPERNGRSQTETELFSFSLILFSTWSALDEVMVRGYVRPKVFDCSETRNACSVLGWCPSSGVYSSGKHSVQAKPGSVCRRQYIFLQKKLIKKVTWKDQFHTERKV